MAIVEMNFHCLRCGYEYTDKYDTTGTPQELTCPKCKSNSVRKLPKKKPKSPQKEK